MSIGDIALGWSQGFHDYVMSERQRQRQAEDDNLAYQMQVIQKLADRPDADPEMMGRQLDLLRQLHDVKAQRRQPAKGTAGFMGASDQPQRMADVLHQFGQVPLYGEMAPQGMTQPELPQTIGASQQPRVAPQDAVQTPQAAPGAAISPAPIPQPPPVAPPSPEPLTGPADESRMLDAGRDLMKYQGAPAAVPGGIPTPPQLSQHGWLLPPAYRTAQAQQQEFDKARLANLGKVVGDIEGARRYAQEPENVRELIPGLPNISRPRSGAAAAGRAQIKTQPDGTAVLISPDGTVETLYDDVSGNPLQLGAAKSSAAGIVTSTDKAGNLWRVDKATGTATLTQGPGGERLGKPQQPPQGTVAYFSTPGSEEPGAYRVRGNTATPITITGQSGQPGMPATKPAPPEKMSAVGKRSLQGIYVAQGMIPDLMKDLKQIGLSNNPISQTAYLGLAKRGWSPGAIEEQLLQSLGVTDAYGVSALLGGSRNMKMVDIIRIHLPQPGDSTLLAYQKLNTLSKLLPKIEAAIKKAESAKPGEGPAVGPSAAPQGGTGVAPPPPQWSNSPR